MGNFSRARQRQYIALHTMKVLGEHIESCMNGRVNEKIKGCLNRIERRRLKMLEDYDPSEKQVNTVIRKWKEAMAKHKGDHEWITPVEYTNACLLLADDLHAEGARPGNEWRLLTQSLFTLCKHLDPELNDKDQEPGQRMGELVIRGI